MKSYKKKFLSFLEPYSLKRIYDIPTNIKVFTTQDEEFIKAVPGNGIHFLQLYMSRKNTKKGFGENQAYLYKKGICYFTNEISYDNYFMNNIDSFGTIIFRYSKPRSGVWVQIK